LAVGVTVIAAFEAVTVIVVVPPEIKLVVSLGVKVAVIIELPLPTTVAVPELIPTTDVVAEEYVKVPGVLGVGAVSVKLSP
jgi:hypothetical protein